MSTTRLLTYLAAGFLVTFGFWSSEQPLMLLVIMGACLVGMTRPQRPRPFLPRSSFGWSAALLVVVLGSIGVLWVLHGETDPGSRREWGFWGKFAAWMGMIALLAGEVLWTARKRKVAAPSADIAS
jgi:hypothetical protein